MSTRSLVRFLPLAVLSLAAACAAPMDLPPDFVWRGDRTEFDAVTPDKARLLVRWFHDPTDAKLEFWAGTLETELVEERGYELAGRGDVTGAAGAPGRWFECTANVGGERVGYLVAIWTSGKWVRVVEFGAKAKVFAARVEAVRKALATVRV